MQPGRIVLESQQWSPPVTHISYPFRGTGKPSHERGTKGIDQQNDNVELRPIHPSHHRPPSESRVSSLVVVQPHLVQPRSPGKNLGHGGVNGRHLLLVFAKMLAPCP